MGAENDRWAIENLQGVGNREVSDLPIIEANAASTRLLSVQKVDVVLRNCVNLWRVVGSGMQVQLDGDGRSKTRSCAHASMKGLGEGITFGTSDRVLAARLQPGVDEQALCRSRPVPRKLPLWGVQPFSAICEEAQAHRDSFDPRVVTKSCGPPASVS